MVHKKVMVVDDNPIDRYIAEKNIKKFGLAEEVVLVESAEDALEHLKSLADTEESLPDIIFLDINMPDMSGFDFLDEYAKLPELLKQKSIVIMLTTSLHGDDIKAANESPYVHRFVNKPLNAEKISEIKAG